MRWIGTVVLLGLFLLAGTFGGVPSVTATGGEVAAHAPTSPGTEVDRDPTIETVPDARIVNANSNDLPAGCDAVAGNRSVTVRAGRTYAAGGEMFAYDTDLIRVDPCTRLTVTFVNEDEVRHQWMVHGLPRETYPMGMFTIALTGPGKATATFITPSEAQSLSVHCSLLQHEQKGMHARLVVGNPTATTGTAVPTKEDRSAPAFPTVGVLLLLVGGLLAVLAARIAHRRTKDK
ncbi:MAG: hypothetical protein ABEJ94_07255 [Halorientalis sp.]